MFGNIPGVHIIADDMLIAGDTEEEHDTAITKVLKNIKLSLPKLRFKKLQVVYHGNSLLTEGIQADKSEVKAVQNIA